MNEIDNYFKGKSSKISFIELMEGAFIEINGYIVKDNIPLPIATNTLVKEIKKGNVDEEFKVAYLIEGVIYILGIDYDFKFKDEYKKILYNYDSKIEDYILYRGFKHIENKNYEDGAIFFRALTNINNKNINGIFNYALSLENISKDFINKGDQTKGEVFLIESTNQLESILDIDPKFSLVYYKLGYHYKYYEQFLKAKLIWKKYLKFDDDQERIQEVREQLELITDDVDFEEGLNRISNGEYELALEKFLKLALKHEEWWNIFYLAGLAYKGLGQYENAIDFFYEAIELDGKNVDVYNELGICLFGTGDINEAIEIFDEGIALDDTDYKIVFNRGMAFLQLGIIEKAIEDISTAYRLNPNDMAVKNQMKRLEKLKENI